MTQLRQGQTDDLSVIWQNPEVLCIIFSITISGDSASHFLQMIMLISLKGFLLI